MVQVPPEVLRRHIWENVQVDLMVIAASHRVGGHSFHLAQEAVQAARGVPGVTATVVELARTRINPCLACEDGDGRRRCVSLTDDGEINWAACPATRREDRMIELWQQMLKADGLIIVAATYAANVPGVLKDFMDRTVTALKTRKYWLRDKVGGAMAVAAHPHGGQEFAVMAIENFYRILGMIIVTDGAPTEDDIEQYGGVCRPGSRQSVVWDRAHFCAGTADPPRGAIKDDIAAVLNARGLGRHVAEVAKWVKAGRTPFQLRVYQHFAADHECRK